MREDFLHFLWRYRRFEMTELRTTTGDPIEILVPGRLNTHAGPDFENARLRIAGTLWAGSVEMHLRASDWDRHGHQNDGAYNNVILHVVLEHDAPAHRKDGSLIPVLEMRQRIPPGLQQKYQALLHSHSLIPCAAHFKGVPLEIRNLWMERLAVERLESKTEVIQAALSQSGNHWEETFYRQLARSFGGKINGDPFERLARSLPLSVLAKHRGNALQLEALLFGQAGFLGEDFTDEYPLSIQKEYNYLKNKYSLTPLPLSFWKFLRMRPASFPTLRIAQFAALVRQSVHLFSKILETDRIKALEELFLVKAGGYWQEHYVFEKPSKHIEKSLGEDAVHAILINTVAPFLFLYGRMRDEADYKERALRLLECLEPEGISALAVWRPMGVRPQSAYETQSLLQLQTHYCAEKKCLHCGVGCYLLK